MRCHKDISSGSGSLYFQGFESEPPGWSAAHGGIIVSNKHALCGGKSVRNPYNLYNDKETQLSKNPYVSG